MNSVSGEFLSVTRILSLLTLIMSLTLGMIPPGWSQESQPRQNPQTPGETLDLDPEIFQNSPVLQRWLEEIPDVLEEIKQDRTFPTLIRFGYSQFPSNHQSGGVNLEVRDIGIGDTKLTVSGEYQGSFNGDRTTFGTDLHYFLRPLGSYLNVAPVVGYRNMVSEEFSTDGLKVGLRLIVAFSPQGAADLSLTQSFVSPGGAEEVGVTNLSVGYAITPHVRLATDIEKQNSSHEKDSRVSLVVEWMP